VSKAWEQPAGGAASFADASLSQDDIEAMLSEARSVDALLHRIARISLAIALAADTCLPPVVAAAGPDAPRIAPAFDHDDPSR
jgi:hypothetical protein